MMLHFLEILLSPRALHLPTAEALIIPAFIAKAITINSKWNRHDMMIIEYKRRLSLGSLSIKQTNPHRNVKKMYDLTFLGGFVIDYSSTEHIVVIISA